MLADIPGLIEGAHKGVGLGHGFLRHIERTTLLLHVLDVAGSEGRDPLRDFYRINDELARYSSELAKRPQIIAANKIDLPGAREALAKISNELESKGYNVIGISAVTGEGLGLLMDKTFELFKSHMEQKGKEDTEQAKQVRYYRFKAEKHFTIEKAEGVFIIKGDWVDRLMERINIHREESLKYFQRALRKRGITDELKRMGIKEGDTVRIGHNEFEYIE